MDATRSFFATVNVGGSMTFNGTGNVVDGMINNWAEDGEPRQDLPEDAVEEFKVSNAESKAEFGSPPAASCRWSPSPARTFFADGVRVFPQQVAQRARRVRDREAGVPPQPVRRQRRRPDRARSLHFFGAFERTDTDEFYTVNTGQPQFYSALEGTFPLRRIATSTLSGATGRSATRRTSSRAILGEAEKKACQGCGGTSHRAATGDPAPFGRRRAHLDARTRQLNDFRFQYAYAAFYGYPGGSECGRPPASSRPSASTGPPGSTASRR